MFVPQRQRVKQQAKQYRSRSARAEKEKMEQALNEWEDLADDFDLIEMHQQPNEKKAPTKVIYD